MWLASASWRDELGRTIATGDWSEEQRRRARQALINALVWVGCPSRQRLFRMNITLCLHRALSDRERDMLPDSFWSSCGGLAGGPVELLETMGLAARPAALPCRNPGRKVLDRERPDLWLPIDCKQCEPCLARLEIDRERQAVTG